MTFNILIVKETRAGERRVAIIPDDVKKLVHAGHRVYIEHEAGKAIEFSDLDYKNSGAFIRFIDKNDLHSYQNFFKDINIVVRVKRPARDREIFENQAMAAGTILIGALDPLEKNATHYQEYHKAEIIPHSIDQLDLQADDPMNVLAAMSRISGRLALLDAISKFHSPIKKVVILGFGIVGQSAFREAVARQLPTTVILSNKNNISEIESCGAQVVFSDKNESLQQQQFLIKDALMHADIVITSARRANQIAPLLIPAGTLKDMQKGSVIVDMAISEGGNVEGAEHDVTQILGNEVVVTNTSGYPKLLPHEASILWSSATLKFLFSFIK